MREVAAKVGQKNPSAVIYHFRNKAKLVQATMNMRAVQMEPERKKLLDDLVKSGDQGNVRGLYRCLAHPLLSVRDNRGIHVAAAFQRRVVGSIYFPTSDFESREDLSSLFRIIDLLRCRLQHLDEVSLRYRMVACGSLLLNTIAFHDSERKAERATPPLNDVCEDAYLMIEAALLARAHPLKSPKIWSRMEG